MWIRIGRIEFTSVGKLDWGASYLIHHARMSERIMESQEAFIMRRYEEEETESEKDEQATLYDIAFTADLYLLLSGNDLLKLVLRAED